MTYPIDRVPARLSEMGVTDIVVILRDFDKDTETLYLEVAARVERELPDKVCEDIRDIARLYSGQWTQSVGTKFQRLTAIEELHVEVGFGIYLDKERA